MINIVNSELRNKATRTLTQTAMPLLVLICRAFKKIREPNRVRGVPGTTIDLRYKSSYKQKLVLQILKRVLLLHLM